MHVDILSSPVLFRSNFYSDNSADNSLLTLAPIVCEGFVWSWFCDVVLRPNIKISVFRVAGLKILGSRSRVGTHIFGGKKYNFMHFERHFAFQDA